MAEMRHRPVSTRCRLFRPDLGHGATLSRWSARPGPRRPGRCTGPLFSLARSPDVIPALTPPHPRLRAGPPFPPDPLSCSPRHTLGSTNLSAVIGFAFVSSRFQSTIFIPSITAVRFPLPLVRQPRRPRSPRFSRCVKFRFPFVALSPPSLSPSPTIFSPPSLQVRVVSR